jgi:nitrite reductase (NADH) small subunit
MTALVDGAQGRPRWVRITACDNIPPREGRRTRVGSLEIAIFNLGDRFLAIDNRCPHQGGPLADGIVSGEAVVCPLHAWKISLATGCVERPVETTTCLRAYATRVEAGVVLIELPANENALAPPSTSRETANVLSST